MFKAGDQVQIISCTGGIQHGFDLWTIGTIVRVGGGDYTVEAVTKRGHILRQHISASSLRLLVPTDNEEALYLLNKNY